MKRHLSQIHRGEEKVRRNKKERKKSVNNSKIFVKNGEKPALFIV